MAVLENRGGLKYARLPRRIGTFLAPRRASLYLEELDQRMQLIVLVFRTQNRSFGFQSYVGDIYSWIYTHKGTSLYIIRWKHSQALYQTACVVAALMARNVPVTSVGPGQQEGPKTLRPLGLVGTRFQKNQPFSFA